MGMHILSLLGKLLSGNVSQISEHFRRPDIRIRNLVAYRLRGISRYRPGQLKIAPDTIDYVDSASLLSSWEEIFVDKHYAFTPLVSKPFIIDLGLNIGLAQLYWRKAFKEFDGLAFEPDPDICEVAKRNCQRWGVGTQIINSAVGSYNGECTMYQDGADGGTIHAELAGTAHQRTIKTRIMRLSPFIDRDVDLLKIDVEGSEIDILAEISSRLHLVRNLVVELHPNNQILSNSLRIISVLREAGFDFVVNGQVSHEPFIRQNYIHPPTIYAFRN